MLPQAKYIQLTLWTLQWGAEGYPGFGILAGALTCNTERNHRIHFMLMLCFFCTFSFKMPTLASFGSAGVAGLRRGAAAAEPCGLCPDREPSAEMRDVGCRQTLGTDKG